MIRIHRRAAIAGLTVASLAVAGSSVLFATAAGATPVPEAGAVGVLALDATPYPFQNNILSPGESVYWPITANLNAPTDAALTMKVSSELGLATDAAGLRLVLRSCPAAWLVPADPADPATCSGGAGTTVIADSAFASLSPSHIYPLGAMASVSQRFFLATLTLPDATPRRLQGESADFTFTFAALGDTDSANPNDPGDPDDPGDPGDPGALAFTGVSPIGALVLTGGMLLGAASFALLRIAQRRTDRLTNRARKVAAS